MCDKVKETLVITLTSRFPVMDMLILMCDGVMHLSWDENCHTSKFVESFCWHDIDSMYVHHMKAWPLHAAMYRSGTVISKSFVGKDFLRNNWKYELTLFELTVHFRHEMIANSSHKLPKKWNFKLTMFELTVPNLYHLFRQKSHFTLDQIEFNVWATRKELNFVEWFETCECGTNCKQISD